MRHPIPQSFYRRPTEQVAKDLLGLVLVRQWRGKETASMIVETEAYDGFEDKASHAYKGQTLRNGVMFGAPGHWYVYLCYGMHWMLNVVTRERGYPAAVLIRGVEETRGPGRLTAAMHITGAQNDTSAFRHNGLWVEDRGLVIARACIQKTPRIGVAYAGEWAQVPRRFVYDPLARRT